MPPRLEALVTAPAITWGGQIDAIGDLFLTAQDYYAESAAPSGGDLLADWQADLASQVGSTTVALDSATGIITLTFGSGTHTYTFADTGFRDLLGFTGNLTPAAASFVAPNQMASIWLPNVETSGQPGSVNSLGIRDSDGVVQRAKSGKVWGTTSNDYTTTRFEYEALTKAKTFKEDESTVNESFERFWESYIKKFTAFRYYKDRTSATSYLTPGSSNRDYVLSEKDFKPTRVRRNNDVAWRLMFDAMLVV